jgi:hypothetical protein
MATTGQQRKKKYTWSQEKRKTRYEREAAVSAEL